MVTKNKTPAEVEAVTITMSRETAQAVKQACEEYLRFRMGQFEDFTNEVCCWDYVDKMEKRCHTTEERKQFHKDHEADFLKCILISWGGDDVARDSGAGLLLDVPPVTGGNLVYFLVECGHVLDLLLIF